jgi:hypothetical protein
MRHQILVVFFLLIHICPVKGATEFDVIHDFQKSWHVFQEERYSPYIGDEGVSSIYFQVSAHNFRNQQLYIASLENIGVFVNGQLVYDGKEVVFAIDSMATLFRTSNLSIAVFQKSGNFKGLKTQVVKEHKHEIHSEEEPRRNSNFRDFVVSGLLLLVLFIVSVARLSPKMVLDYFSIQKVFSMRESDEKQSHSRTTNSANIVFLLFCSLLVGYSLMIIFHYLAPYYAIAAKFQGESYIGIIGNWLYLSTITMGFCFLKISLIYVLATILSAPDVARLHIFNWMRVLMLIFGGLMVIISTYVIMYGMSTNFFDILLHIVPWLIGGWIILIFLKLTNKIGNSVFHLFSYICITELFPFLVTVKVLFS